VPLGAISVTDTINPPGFESVFWLRNLGVAPEAAATGTVFAATHALDAGLAPGNYLNDLAVGALIRVGPAEYHVTRLWRIAKPELAAAGPQLWADRPGRLVVVTCVPGSFDNLIVEAEQSAYQS